MRYYATNVGGTFSLVEGMQRAGVYTLVFSSAATVYGAPTPGNLPLTEEATTDNTFSPYTASKYMVERYLADLYAAQPQWRIARLRYFNPVGAHESCLIGENPRDTPNNLMPYISQVACGARPMLQIFGDDYPTPDGTGVRVYLHVMDMAEGHAATLHYLAQHNAGELLTLNLGTGQGLSVLEVVRAFEAACGHPIPYQITARRPGDLSRAQALLHWRAQRSLHQICADTWRWQSANPQGYGVWGMGYGV